ncbi:MAG: hypothetical protein Q7S59_00110 [Sulfurimonas sp.]|nr:hypothetical protein [Sulfurimonas sp.]
MPNFSKTEKIILDTLKKNAYFNYEGNPYRLIKFDKPTTSTGEPKTDIYILSKTVHGKNFEFKISVKQSNADFLENKINAERASKLFGTKWQELIKSLTNSVKNDFTSQKLIYKAKQGKTEEGVFTLGWKFEILNKSATNRSAELPKEILREVLTGENLNSTKKNAFIKGETIQNSGVANFILPNAEHIDLTNLNAIMGNIITIDKYINNPINKVYFACKALNYRSKYKPSPKWDGDRPLSVYVNWFEDNNKLHHKFCFDNPLNKKGNAVAKDLQAALASLNIVTTDDINCSNISDYSIVCQ